MDVPSLRLQQYCDLLRVHFCFCDFLFKNMFMSKLNFSIEKSKYKLKNLLQYLIEIFLTALNFTDRRRRSNVLKVYKKCRIPIQNFLNRNYLKSLVIYDAIF